MKIDLEQNMALNSEWWGGVPPQGFGVNPVIGSVEGPKLSEVKLEKTASGSVYIPDTETFKAIPFCPPYPTSPAGLPILEEWWIPNETTTGTTIVIKDKPPEVATKYDEGKLDYSIMPLDSLEEVAKVFMFGAKKYERWNFAKGNGMAWTRIWKSLLRHAFAWVRGEDNDPESGFSHLAHAGCCIFMLLHYVKNPTRYSQDDRYKY